MKYGEYLEVGADGLLRIEGVPATELAREYGTPLFVMSENTIRANYRAFRDAFTSRYPGDVLICVGMKANWGLAARKVIVDEGGGGDAFGLGELYVALLAGTPPEKIVMNGPNKSEEVLRAAVDAGIIVNVDNLDELTMIRAVAAELGKKANVALRIRLPLEKLMGRRYVDPRYGEPGIDVARWERHFKFGMEPEAIYEAVDHSLSSPEINLQGLMYHGGIPRRAGYFAEETEELIHYVGEVHRRFSWAPHILNLGGGFAGRRFGQPAPPSVDDYADGICSRVVDGFHRLGLPLPKLILEPGRFCWESAVVWLTRVGNVKADRVLTDKKWVFIDGSLNEMGDPFDPFVSYHHVVVANDGHRPNAEVVDICGPLCNAADVLAREREVPELRTGDLLAFLDMGAYNEAFANQSNAMPRSASVMVSRGRTAVVRRRETVQDVLSRERVPYWMFAR